MGRLRRSWWFVARLLWLACLATGFPAIGRAESKDVLVIYSQFRLLSDYLQVDTGLMRTSDLLPSSGVRFFTEYLDYPYFTGEGYERQTADYLADKYAGRPPRVVVAGGDAALKFVLQYRDRMFPGVPVVHLGVSRKVLDSFDDLPQDVTGVPVDLDVGGTIDLARQLHPDAKRLVVVTGASQWAQDRDEEIVEALAARRRLPLSVEFWSGLSTEDLLARLRTLGPESIVFTPGYFRDGAGSANTPLDSVRLMVATTSAPVYTVFASLVGAGVVGGRMSTNEDMGRTARLLVDGILDGRPPRSLAQPPLPTRVHLDWRQLEQRDVPESRWPADAVLQFRTPSFWEAYRVQAFTAVFIGVGQGVMILALLLERRRRQKTANALLDAQRRMDMAAKAARLSVFVWEMWGGQDGGRSAAAAPGASQRFADVLAQVDENDRERLRAAVQHTLHFDAELDVEYRVAGSDGQARWIASRGQRAASDGRFITGVSTDVSDKKAVDLQASEDRAALTYLSRVAALGQLSAAIAHQLHQPLTAIMLNAHTARSMLGRSHPPLEDLKEILVDIIDDNARAADTIRNLQALYRQQPAQDSAVFDLNELTAKTVELLRSELIDRGVATRLELASGLAGVVGNQIQIQQVVLNLIVNAMDAMASTESGERVLLLRSTSSQGSVRLEVADRGMGISSTALARIFEPFWTTKRQGVGVGLSICRTIVHAHGGTLTARNTPGGKGASFVLELPAHAA